MHLQGSILGAFELPAKPAHGVGAALWLEHGRRVLITDSLQAFPGLWDGAALAPLPLPPAFSQIASTEVRWLGADGRTLPAVSFSLRGTPPEAPLILEPCDPRDGMPHFRTSRAAACGGGGAPSLLPLLLCGYRVICIDCAPPTPSASPPQQLTARWGPAGVGIDAHGRCAGAVATALAQDVLSGLDEHRRVFHGGGPHLASTQLGGSAALGEGLAGPQGDAPQRPSPSVGLLGAGHGGHLVLRVLAAAYPATFAAAVTYGAHMSERWLDKEAGNAPAVPPTVAAAAAAAAAAPAHRRERMRADAAAAAAAAAAASAAAASLAAEDEEQFHASLSKAQTPVLLLHGGAGTACGISQARAAYHVLRGSESVHERRCVPAVHPKALPSCRLLTPPS